MKNKLKLYDFSLLKSNMDRFIDYANRCDYIFIKVLKSNMDRFIVVKTADEKATENI